MVQNTRVIILAVTCAVLGIATGVVIGYFSNNNQQETVVEPLKPQADPNAGKMIMDEIQSAKLEENLRILTENPHIAGRDVDEKTLVDFVAARFRSAGLEVEIHPYDVLLSYPNQTDSNFIAIKMEDGSLVNKSHPNEAILDPSQNKSGVVNPFNGYSAAGDPEADPVYVNYARVEDFIGLQTINISTTDKICIGRYGKIFRGDKARLAEQYGCAGLLLYSDPIDYTLPGLGVYPDSWYLPGTGAQRGTLKLLNGDPLTPHYPATDTAWRANETDVKLPRIPVTPIGYDDAIMYLGKMNGDIVNDSWKGGMNISYRYGPGFAAPYEKSKLRMHVTTTNQRATTHNVIGFLRGAVEPDRYVLIGNHRDAWVFGAIDPSSGTATTLEIARSYSEAVKNGWKPRRTIVFCSWGAEEQGLIGSTEWVEEFQKVLSARSVAYLNVDSAVLGNFSFHVDTIPSLKQLIYDSAKSVPTADQSEIAAGRETVYDTWKFRLSSAGDPPVGGLGSGSDYTMFIQVVGITSANFEYAPNRNLGLASYPVYHSVYETFDLVKTFVDPEFKYYQATGRVVAEIGRRLADYPVLPFNIQDYADKMKEDKNTMYQTFESKMIANGIDTNVFGEALDNFTSAARDLHKRIDELDTTDTLALRLINDQLMQLDRAFIDTHGIEGRPTYRHVIFSPSQYNAYGSSAFPGLVDSMFNIDIDPDQAGRWEEVRRQYSILVYHIGSATSTIRDVVPIMGYSNRA